MGFIKKDDRMMKLFKASYLKASDESFEYRLGLAQRRGLEANLVGFALQGLPNMITKAAQARNQFVWDNIRIAAQPYGVGAVNIGGNYNL